MGDERSILYGTCFDEGAALKQRHGLFAGCRNSRFKAALAQGVTNQVLDLLIVFDDQNDR